jgi:hypothetical protein
MSDPSPEERAEELMERLASEGARRVSRFVGRAREEIEDVIAEARTLNNQKVSRRPGSSRSSSDRPATPTQR